MNKLKLITATSYAGILTIVFVVTLTIWAEFSAPLKDSLKSVTGHHWTTKSVFSALLFVVATAAVYPLLKKVSDARVKMALQTLIASAVLGVVLFLAFFTGHYLKVF